MTYISQEEINEINQKLAQFIGEKSSYGFNGDIDDELPSFANPNEYEYLDDSFNDIDFSELKGDVKKNLHKINKKVNSRQGKQKYIRKRNAPKMPLTKEFGVNRKATIIGQEQKKLAKVSVPRDRKVVIEGVNSFILTDTKDNNLARNIGYYKGKKLQQLNFIFNNNTPLDFDLELFNPSMPLDYLYSTSLNLNDRISVAGSSSVSYSDVLFNILANPIFVPNATIVISGTQKQQQLAQPLIITNKFINAFTKVEPLNIALQIDTMQVEGENVSFEFSDVLNKPYVPDGMEIITYKILAGNTVSLCFYYEQKAIKKLFFPEARPKLNLF